MQPNSLNNPDQLIEAAIKAQLANDFSGVTRNLGHLKQFDIETVLIAIRKLLVFMEDNEQLDFGTPGPIVHFMESFYKKGYEDLLIESVRRKPFIHNIWMLNRLINGSSGSEKEGYLALINELKQDAHTPNTLIEFINMIQE